MVRSLFSFRLKHRRPWFHSLINVCHECVSASTLVNYVIMYKVGYIRIIAITAWIQQYHVNQYLYFFISVCHFYGSYLVENNPPSIFGCRFFWCLCHDALNHIFSNESSVRRHLCEVSLALGLEKKKTKIAYHSLTDIHIRAQIRDFCGRYRY